MIYFSYICKKNILFAYATLATAKIILFQSFGFHI